MLMSYPGSARRGFLLGSNSLRTFYFFWANFPLCSCMHNKFVLDACNSK
uniref:Uncharacterized protein n=1 Tax=Setaria italica TaxID=4555 RepID=K4A489_SETIT